MPKDKVTSAMFIVLIAGLIWSFGPLVVRNIDNAELIPWQYSFFRGSTIFLILNLYLFLNVLSITTTTAAVTMMMLGAMPFTAAILAYIFLKEKISTTTLIAMVIAAAGIIFISFDSKQSGTLFGLINGLISQLGFAGFTVSLRWRKKTPKLTTVSIGGIFAALVSTLLNLST